MSIDAQVEFSRKLNAHLQAATERYVLLESALTLARQALINLQAEGESRYTPIIRKATEALDYPVPTF